MQCVKITDNKQLETLTFNSILLGSLIGNGNFGKVSLSVDIDKSMFSKRYVLENVQLPFI